MLKYSEVSVGQRPMRSYTWKNQSLVGVSNRLLRHVDADAASARHQPVYVNFADLKFSTVNAIVVCIALALGTFFIAVMPQRGMRTAQSDATEFALLLALAWLIGGGRRAHDMPEHGEGARGGAARTDVARLAIGGSGTTTA